MRIATIIALFAILLAGTAFAGDNGNGCKLQGTWIIGGQGGHTSLATYQGTGDNVGTEDVEIIIPTGPLPPGSRITSVRGVWTKSGPNSYDYAMQGYLIGPENQVIFIFITRGTKTLTSCNTMEASVVTDYYWPGEEVPFLTESTPMIGRRLLVDQAAPIQ